MSIIIMFYDNDNNNDNNINNSITNKRIKVPCSMLPKHVTATTRRASPYLRYGDHLTAGLRSQLFDGRLGGQTCRAAREAVAPRSELSAVTRAAVHLAVVLVTVRAVETPPTRHYNDTNTDVTHLTHTAVTVSDSDKSISLITLL